MLILPAIDLYEKKAVRLHKGDYAEMTVYNDHPLAVRRPMPQASPRLSLRQACTSSWAAASAAWTRPAGTWTRASAASSSAPQR